MPSEGMRSLEDPLDRRVSVQVWTSGHVPFVGRTTSPAAWADERQPGRSVSPDTSAGEPVAQARPMTTDRAQMVDT